MREPELAEYLRRIIHSVEHDRLEEGTIADWETWFNATKYKDKGINQFIKLIINLGILEKIEDKQGKYRLHDESWKIAKEYYENNIKCFQITISLYDVIPSRSKGTLR